MRFAKTLLSIFKDITQTDKLVFLAILIRQITSEQRPVVRLYRNLIVIKTFSSLRGLIYEQNCTLGHFQKFSVFDSTIIYKFYCNILFLLFNIICGFCMLCSCKVNPSNCGSRLKRFGLFCLL